jgi:hypothetical protein
MTLHQREPIVVGAAGVLGMDVCATARQIIVTERRKAVRGEGDALDGHALLTRLKVAAGLAIMDKSRNVSDEDWQLSGVIAAMSDATRSRVIAHRQDEVRKQATGRALAEADRQVIVTETVAEKSVARVARGVLRRLDDGEMVHSVARTKVAHRDRDYFDDAVDHLVRAGQIIVDELPNGSRHPQSGGQVMRHVQTCTCTGHPTKTLYTGPSSEGRPNMRLTCAFSHIETKRFISRARRDRKVPCTCTGLYTPDVAVAR